MARLPNHERAARMVKAYEGGDQTAADAFAVYQRLQEAEDGMSPGVPHNQAAMQAVVLARADMERALDAWESHRTKKRKATTTERNLSSRDRQILTALIKAQTDEDTGLLLCFWDWPPDIYSTLKENPEWLSDLRAFAGFARSVVMSVIEGGRLEEEQIPQFDKWLKHSRRVIRPRTGARPVDGSYLIEDLEIVPSGSNSSPIIPFLIPLLEQVLLREKHWLAKCPECGEPFAKTRRGQTYDTHLCGSRAGMREHRRKKVA